MRRILLIEITENVIDQKRRFAGSLMKVGLSLVRNIPTPPAKNVLLALGVTGATSATDAVIQKKTLQSGTTLIISNEEMTIS